MAAKWMFLFCAFLALPVSSNELICSVGKADGAVFESDEPSYPSWFQSDGEVIRFDLGSKPRTAWFSEDDDAWVWDQLKYSEAGSGYYGHSDLGGVLSAVFSKDRERVVVTYVYQDFEGEDRNAINVTVQYAVCKPL